MTIEERYLRNRRIWDEMQKPFIVWEQRSDYDYAFLNRGFETEVEAREFMNGIAGKRNFGGAILTKRIDSREPND